MQVTDDQHASISFLPKRQIPSVENLKVKPAGGCWRCIGIFSLIGAITCAGFYLWYKSLISHGHISYGEPEWEILEAQPNTNGSLSGE